MISYSVILLFGELLCQIFECSGRTIDTCYLNNTEYVDSSGKCFWYAEVNACRDATLWRSCYYGSSTFTCSICRSLYECTVNQSKTNCTWSSTTHTCSPMSENNCSSGICADCMFKNCYTDNNDCWWNGSVGACRDKDDYQTCDATSAYSCSSCKSASECQQTRSDCTWDAATYTCGACAQGDCWVCTGKDECYYSGNEDCWWNDSGKCLDRKKQISCYNYQYCFNCRSIYECGIMRGECIWSSEQHQCGNCSVQTCWACQSSSSCRSVGNKCYWKEDNTSSSCMDSDLNPSCDDTNSSSCASCLNYYDCSKARKGCEWSYAGDNSRCGLCEEGDCWTCNSSVLCWTGGGKCYYDKGCKSSDEFPSCTSTSSCASCKSHAECDGVQAVVVGCTWSAANNTCINTSSCAYTKSRDECYVLSERCWYTSSGCRDADTSPSCSITNSSTTCSTCRSQTECTRARDGKCFWNAVSHDCSNAGGGGGGGNVNTSEPCSANNCSMCVAELLCTLSGTNCQWASSSSVYGGVCSIKSSSSPSTRSGGFYFLAIGLPIILIALAAAVAVVVIFIWRRKAGGGDDRASQSSVLFDTNSHSESEPNKM